MKKQILLLFSALAIFTTAFKNSKSHVDIFRLDVASSKLEWKGKKITGEHTGNISFIGGKLLHNHGAFTGEFEVDMNSIVCHDLKGDSKTKLENHLKSEDFFDAKSFPKATLVITSIIPLQGNAEGYTHTVNGNMTIRDKTNPVSFNAKLNSDASGNLLFEGTAVIDRSRFDVKHRSKTFFPEIGDKIIYDEFSLAFSVKLTR